MMKRLVIVYLDCRKYRDERFQTTSGIFSRLLRQPFSRQHKQTSSSLNIYEIW